MGYLQKRLPRNNLLNPRFWLVILVGSLIPVLALDVTFRLWGFFLAGHESEFVLIIPLLVLYESSKPWIEGYWDRRQAPDLD